MNNAGMHRRASGQRKSKIKHNYRSTDWRIYARKFVGLFIVHDIGNFGEFYFISITTNFTS